MKKKLDNMKEFTTLDGLKYKFVYNGDDDWSIYVYKWNKYAYDGFIKAPWNATYRRIYNEFEGKYLIRQVYYSKAV